MPGGPGVDPVAIWLAITGSRRVELNATEQLLAMALILAAGGRQVDVVDRLGIDKVRVCRLNARLRATVGLAPAA